MTQTTTSVRQILEDCQPGFAEVVLMLGDGVTTAAVYTMFKDLRFSGDVVTFMAEGGTHLHMHMDRIKEVRFSHYTNSRGLPSYLVSFIGEGEPTLRVYLRKSDKEETNQPRHDLFMRLKEKHGEVAQVRS